MRKTNKRVDKSLNFRKHKCYKKNKREKESGGKMITIFYSVMANNFSKEVKTSENSFLNKHLHDVREETKISGKNTPNRARTNKY